MCQRGPNTGFGPRLQDIDIDDPRESPSLRIIELLRGEGAHVDYHNPYFPHLPKTRKYHFDLESVFVLLIG